MSLRVVGAGLGRTGTLSLKLALEELLGAPCYHMVEAVDRPEHAPLWTAASRGEPVDWDALMNGYVASVDWPACAFWRELAGVYPGAIVLLSTRRTAEEWWQSMSRTIVPTVTSEVPAHEPELARHRAMVQELLTRRFTPGWANAATAMAAYERHNEEVRRSVGGERLLEWKPGDGWEPICGALALDVPAQPFPHENTAADFRARQGLEAD
jgi:hypothetical protein